MLVTCAGADCEDDHAPGRGGAAVGRCVQLLGGGKLSGGDLVWGPGGCDTGSTRSAPHSIILYFPPLYGLTVCLFLNCIHNTIYPILYQCQCQCIQHLKQHIPQMQLSPAAHSFAQRLLHHYPLSACNQNSCQHQHGTEHQHKHEHDSRDDSKQPQQQQQHQQHQPFQPFQHLHDHRKQRQIYQRPTEQKLDNMAYFKQLGNQKYKQGQYEQAGYYYHKVIIYGDYTFPQQPAQQAQLSLLLQQANLNLAMCLIKQAKWSQAGQYLTQAVHSQEAEKWEGTRQQACNTSKKGYYWQCRCHIRAGEYAQAEEVLGKMEGLQGAGEEVAELRKELQAARDRYEAKMQGLTKKMFGNAD